MRQLTFRGSASILVLTLCLLAACAGPDLDYDARDNYVSADDTPVIVRGPTGVVVDTPFQVEWAGPGESDDRIEVIPRGGPQILDRTSVDLAGGTPATLTAPSEAGLYEIAYVSGNGDILATQPLTVSQPD